MPLLSVPANDIDVPGLALDVQLPAAWLNAELSDADTTSDAPAHFTARLSRSGADVIVRGRVKASLSTPCARCLRPTPVAVDADLSLLLHAQPRSSAPSHARGRDTGAENGDARKNKRNDKSDKSDKSARSREPEYEFSADEADVDTYDGETVVLDPFVREAILLEMPNFPLCSEACPGIGPAASAGAPLTQVDAEGEADESAPPAIDPRLAPLSALRDKLGKTLPSAADKRPQSSSSRPAQPGTPKKKTKKE